MPRVLAILPHGFEEIEAVTPIDLLRRAGAEVTIAGLSDEQEIAGRCGMRLRPDVSLSNASDELYDCLLLPGGPGVKNLRTDSRVRQRVIAHHAAGRWVAAICAAPTVLLDAGVLTGRRHTAHFSVADELPGLVAGERVVVDGNVITSRGAGTAMDFGLILIEKLFSPEKSAEIGRSVCA